MLFCEGFSLTQSFYLHQDKNYFIDFIPEKQNQKSIYFPLSNAAQPRGVWAAESLQHAVGPKFDP